MNVKLLLPVIAFLAAATAGCGLSPYRQPAEEAAAPTPSIPPATDQQTVQEKIYSQHRQWKGTRYLLGGLSRRGVDCSGLVYTTYREQFGIELPRTTRYQAQAGRPVKRSELRAGDLVFFRTGYKVRHVGIYIEDNKFFHASTSRGVTISELDGYYWQDKYRHARRLEFNPEYRLPMK